MAAVEALVGVQAQMARPAFVALWSRIDGVTRQQIADALVGKRLVRGTAFRGTLHLMSAADFLRFRAPLQAALDRGLRIVGDRTAGADLDRVIEIATAFFQEPRTFEAFRDHLAESMPGGDLRALAYTARMRLPLLQVPANTAWAFPARADFIAAKAWLPASKTRPAGVDDVVRRYLAAYGPATVADAQAWTGIGGLKPVFEQLRPALATFKTERAGELFDLPDAPRPDPDCPAPVRFLPDWDNAIVGRADARFLASEHRTAVFKPGLRVLPTVLVDGAVAATWTVTRRKAAATLTVTPIAKLASRVKAEIEAEGLALLAFAEPEATNRAVAF